MSGMPRLIARAVDRALAAVAAKVTPLLSVKRGPVLIAELHKTNDRSRDEVGTRIGDPLNPQAPEANDPIALLDIGCGPQLKMLSILRDDDVVEVYRTSGRFEPASLMVWFELARQSSYALDVGAYPVANRRGKHVVDWRRSGIPHRNNPQRFILSINQAISYRTS